MSSPWWAAFPPADASVSCAGEHRLRWHDGKLTAVDHPDQESELVLAALGGDQPECVRLVRAWGAHSANLDVLTVGPRTAADKITVPTGAAGWHTGPMMHGFSRPTARTARGISRSMSWARLSAEDSSRSDLLELLKLGSDLTFRLMATVAANATGARARPRLTAALSGRLAPAIHTWLGIDPDRVDARIHDGDGWGELEPAGSGGLRAALPVRWLASVWAPGLAVIDHKLVVDVSEVTWPRAEAVAVSRPGTEPVSLSTVCRNGQWSVARR